MAFSPTALLLGFLPALVVGGFVIWFAQPAGGWLVSDTHGFAENIGVGSVAADLAQLWPVVPFGLGVALGLTLVVVPRRERLERREVPDTTAGEPAQADGERFDESETVVRRERVGAR